MEQIIVLKKSTDVQEEDKDYQDTMIQSEFWTKTAEEKNDQDTTDHIFF